MKKILIGLMCSFLILGFTSGCDSKSNNTSKGSNSITYIEDNSWNIVSETTSDNGVIKASNSSPFVLIAVDNEEIVDYVNLEKDYTVTNSNYKFYKMSLSEFHVNVESSINYKNKDNNYEISLHLSIADPVKFFETANVLNTDTTNNLFGGFTAKDLFNNSLKDILEENLNDIIIEYLDTKNTEFMPNLELEDHISNSLDELIRSTKGIRVISVDLTSK